MHPACPICRQEMAPMDSSDNKFICAPCRQMIQFFGVPAADRAVTAPADAPAADVIRPLPPPLREAMTWPRDGAAAPRYAQLPPRAARQRLRA